MEQHQQLQERHRHLCCRTHHRWQPQHCCRGCPWSTRSMHQAGAWRAGCLQTLTRRGAQVWCWGRWGAGLASRPQALPCLGYAPQHLRPLGTGLHLRFHLGTLLQALVSPGARSAPGYCQRHAPSWMGRPLVWHPPLLPMFPLPLPLAPLLILTLRLLLLLLLPLLLVAMRAQ